MGAGRSDWYKPRRQSRPEGGGSMRDGSAGSTTSRID
jgi:hypothetical protein